MTSGAPTKRRTLDRIFVFMVGAESLRQPAYRRYKALPGHPRRARFDALPTLHGPPIRPYAKRPADDPRASGEELVGSHSGIHDDLRRHVGAVLLEPGAVDLRSLHAAVRGRA